LENLPGIAFHSNSELRLDDPKPDCFKLVATIFVIEHRRNAPMSAAEKSSTASTALQRHTSSTSTKL